MCAFQNEISSRNCYYLGNWWLKAIKEDTKGPHFKRPLPGMVISVKYVGLHFPPHFGKWIKTIECFIVPFQIILLTSVHFVEPLITPILDSLNMTSSHIFYIFVTMHCHIGWRIQDFPWGAPTSQGDVNSWHGYNMSKRNNQVRLLDPPMTYLLSWSPSWFTHWLLLVKSWLDSFKSLT